jgi:hypothetical protein
VMGSYFERELRLSTLAMLEVGVIAIGRAVMPWSEKMR